MVETNPNSGSEDVTPAPSPQSESSPNSAEQTQATTDGDKGALPPALSADERDVRAFAMLDEGKGRDVARKELAAATPDKESQLAAESVPGPASDANVEEVVTHDGLDDKSIKQLSQAGLLLDAADWNVMPQKARDRILARAKETIAERSRAYQQEQANQRARNERGQFTAGAASAQTDKAQSQGGGKSEPAKPGQGDLASKVQKIKEMFGDEAAAPLAEVLEELDKRVAEASAPKDDPRMDYMMQRQVAMDEAAARTSLSADLADLTPPKGAAPEVVQASNEAWQVIREEAQVLAQAAVTAGRPWTWQECLERAGRMLYEPLIRQQEQAKLAATRKQTLRATPERSNRQSSPNRVESSEERDRRAFEALDSGKTRDDARMAIAG